ncbi:MAG: zinc ribbon domain-containing protein, partial [Acidobacteria bacterium]|nr:zinc ribbon domain-containing protein [Acidobacteriota bacterium]
MPLYEYRCLKCGEQVEKIQKFSDPPLRICARCGGILERLLSSPAIQFKGSGWYVTDYTRKSPPPSDKSEVSNPDPNKKSSETPTATTTKDTKSSSDK